MRFTGERVVPNDMHENPIIYSEHIIRYALALKYCSMNSVLDVACGTGYGTDLLGHVSKEITGGDIDVKSLEYAEKRYKLNLKKIDLETQTIHEVFKQHFDTIVSFETIEHLKNAQFFLKSVKEALAPDGVFIFSIPVENRSDFHKLLFSYTQALNVGNAFFKSIKILVQMPQLIIPPTLASGDFNQPGTYVIKAMVKK